MTDFCKLTSEPIDLAFVRRCGKPPECGVTVTLDGYVRGFTAGRETICLVYEAYEEMALNEMQKLIDAAKQRYAVSTIGIIHRIGRLNVGETSVLVSVSAPHRKAAFHACEWVIAELKRTVPIWKKEIYVDGEKWVEAAARP